MCWGFRDHYGFSPRHRREEQPHSNTAAAKSTLDMLLVRRMSYDVAPFFRPATVSSVEFSANCVNSVVCWCQTALVQPARVCPATPRAFNQYCLDTPVATPIALSLHSLATTRPLPFATCWCKRPFAQQHQCLETASDSDTSADLLLSCLVFPVPSCCCHLQVIPELNGKLTGMAFRVPTQVCRVAGSVSGFGELLEP